MTEINPEVIRADLEKIKDKLKVPPAEIYIPKIEEIRYTIGNQWKQRFLVEKEGMLYISPIQYNIDTGRWVNYHEADWDKRPWIKGCGGCHATGRGSGEKQLQRARQSVAKPVTVPGSHHVALPKTAVFEKRMTIVNPVQTPFRSQLSRSAVPAITGGNRPRIESRGMAGGLPTRERPWKPIFKSVSFAAGKARTSIANEFSKGHHQQYIDWRQSKHHTEGVNCTSCHYVHQLGVASTRSQTKASGSQQCLQCHTNGQ